MHIGDTQLLEVLRIGHDTSMRGEGISLRDALVRARYDDLRQGFGASDLIPLLQKNHDMLKQWVMYCEDKRISCGWWISEDSFEVGPLESPESTVRFASLEQAVSEFVIRELDFWSGVNKHRTNRSN